MYIVVLMYAKNIKIDFTIYFFYINNIAKRNNMNYLCEHCPPNGLSRRHNPNYEVDEKCIRNVEFKTKEYLAKHMEMHKIKKVPKIRKSKRRRYRRKMTTDYLHKLRLKYKKCFAPRNPFQLIEGDNLAKTLNSYLV